MSKLSVFLLSALTAIVLLVIVISSPTQAANHQLKRQVAAKQVYESLPEHCDQNVIVLKLREGTNRPILDENRFNASGQIWDRLNDIISETDGTVALRPLMSLAPSRLDKMRAEGSRRVGWQLPDLTLYFEIQLADDLPSHERLNIINDLNSLGLVELAYFSPEIELFSGPPEGKGPPDDPDPEPTPPFEDGQYCLQPAPVGFDAYYAWSFAGGRGENTRVIHVENAWNETHEDWHGGTDHFLIAGVIDSSVDTYHGTAMLGIIAADSNDFGMTGIAYATGIGTVSYTDITVADAIAMAIDNAEPGEIILISCGPWTPFGATVCSEWSQANFDAILTASALGLVVVEAAANSNQDYDDTELYDSLFYPEYRFSGAIMVAMSSAFHVPDQRTCYGQRIDVHGFGSHDVYTLGGGVLWGTELNNSYTQGFSGTSSASGEIAGVCAVAQSIYDQYTGSTLDHVGMRELLTIYSVPQADHYKNIGPLPDLAGICDAITGFIRPTAPTPVSPEDAAEFSDPAQPTLDWDDVTDATSYEVMVDDNFNFTSPVAQEEELASSEWTAPILQQGKYFWRARAVNENGFGSWSDVRSILVDVDIQAPVLLSPEDGGKMATITNVPLEWNCIDGVVDYVVEVDSLSDFSTPHISTYSLPCTDGTCSYNVSYISWGENHYWRVRVLGDNTPWSEEWEIITQGSAVKTISTIPDESAGESSSLRLGSNYPNPFNPVTQITFSLPGATHARLDIFNVLGQKVATLVDGYLSAGEHTAAWDASNNSSGVYLYRLTAGDAVVSKKMLLVK